MLSPTLTENVEPVLKVEELARRLDAASVKFVIDVFPPVNTLRSFTQTSKPRDTFDAVVQVTTTSSITNEKGAITTRSGPRVVELVPIVLAADPPFKAVYIGTEINSRERSDLSASRCTDPLPRATGMKSTSPAGVTPLGNASTCRLV